MKDYIEERNEKPWTTIAHQSIYRFREIIKRLIKGIIIARRIEGNLKLD